MRADFSRVTFESVKHYSRVLSQQGRVGVDADWNEQVDIIAHQIQTEAADVIGRTGAPRENGGFHLVALPATGSTDIAISPGRLYVDGMLCELESVVVPPAKINAKTIQPVNTVLDGNEFRAGQWVQVWATDPTAPNPVQTQITAADVANKTLTVAGDLTGFVGKTGPLLQRIPTYSTQPDYPLAPQLPASNVALVYLDVWERTITALDDAELRDPALGQASGPDTTARTKTVWQVKFVQSSSITSNSTCATVPDFSQLLPQSTGTLSARSQPTGAPSACILPPRAGFRRLENQLYRVEVHVPGNLANAKPTFKWSRENGSVVAAIVSPAPTLSANSLTLNVSTLGRDQVLGFASGQWVELSDDGRELAGLPGILVQLTGAAQGPQGPVLTADTTVASATDLNNFLTGFGNQKVRNPKVRRWDQSGSLVATTSPGGAIPIQEGTPIDLESGVQVTFAPGGNYVTGDYWLIPARTVTGDVDWPRDSAGTPLFRPPRGIRHHYCRLGIVNFNTSTWVLQEDCRQLFAPAADGGIQIQSLSCTKSNDAVLNDAAIALQDIADGISIQCDTPIDPLSLLTNLGASGLSKPVCTLTIDVPNVAAAGKAAFASQPMVVAANLALDVTNTIIQWTPTGEALTWLTSTLATLLSSNALLGRLLARLNVKGSFVWALGNPSVYLDGQAFGAAVAPDTAGNQRTGIALPSGSGRAGSDFNMWFWLISQPGLVATPGIVNFGNQTVKKASQVVSVVVTNNTTAQNPIKTVTIDNPDFTQTTNCLTSPMPAKGGNCNISVTFTPSAPGPRLGTITITPTTGDPVTVQLSGTGIAGILQASPALLGIKAVLGSLASGIVTLSNTGAAPVTITLVGTPTAPQFKVVNLAAGTVVTPGSSLNVIVNFTPSVTGTIFASFQITHDGLGSPLTVSLQGTGSAPSGGGSTIQTKGGILGTGKLQMIKIA